MSLATAHERLAPFAQHHRTNSPGEQLYFVQYDYSDAYDRILKQRLLDMLPSFFSEPLYALQYYAAVGAGPNGGRRTDYTARVCPAREVTPLHVNATGVKAKGCVVVDWSSIAFVRREDIITAIRQHILQHTVRLGGRTFLQEEGIPQGSPLSALLCSLYYGHLERTHLAFALALESGCLMRLIDDSLYVTTVRADAERLAAVVQSESVIAAYGTRINAKKSRFNLTLPLSSSEKEEDVVWCGIRIDCTTLECTWDYTKSLKQIRDTLTVTSAFAEKMRLYVQARCIPLVLDERINSPATVDTTISFLFLHCAHKFVAYASELHPAQGVAHNPDWLWSIVHATLSHAIHLTRRSEAQGRNAHRSNAYALGVRAFLLVLRPHRGRWGVVIMRLEDAIYQ